jgi:outer membrane immunogenic protein
MKPRFLLLASIAALTIFAVPAMGADLRRPMPVKAPPPVVAPLYSWTGCYVGGHAGYAWSRKRVYDVDTGDEIEQYRHNVDGFVAGGQIGCNLWQHERWVFGIEGQASWANVDGDSPPNSPVAQGIRTEIDIIGSIAPRLGYAFGATGQTLVFIKGGAAFVHEQYFITSSVPDFNFRTDKLLRWGWMVGAGVEQALSSNWSVKAEYNFSDFGRDAFDFRGNLCGGGVCTTTEVKQHLHLVKVGINYRFGGFGSPVVARY